MSSLAWRGRLSTPRDLEVGDIVTRKHAKKRNRSYALNCALQEMRAVNKRRNAKKLVKAQKKKG